MAARKRMSNTAGFANQLRIADPDLLRRPGRSTRARRAPVDEGAGVGSVPSAPLEIRQASRRTWSPGAKGFNVFNKNAKREGQKKMCYAQNGRMAPCSGRPGKAGQVAAFMKFYTPTPRGQGKVAVRRKKKKEKLLENFSRTNATRTRAYEAKNGTTKRKRLTESEMKNAVKERTARGFLRGQEQRKKMVIYLKEKVLSTRQVSDKRNFFTRGKSAAELKNLIAKAKKLPKKKTKKTVKKVKRITGEAVAAAYREALRRWNAKKAKAPKAPKASLTQNQVFQDAMRAKIAKEVQAFQNKIQKRKESAATRIQRKARSFLAAKEEKRRQRGRQLMEQLAAEATNNNVIAARTTPSPKRRMANFVATVREAEARARSPLVKRNSPRRTRTNVNYADLNRQMRNEGNWGNGENDEDYVPVEDVEDDEEYFSAEEDWNGNAQWH